MNHLVRASRGAHSPRGLVSIEHGRWAYRADFAFYALASMALAAWLVAHSMPAAAPGLLACVAAGLFGWTALEYGLHRFVLHGLAPFSGWHAQHHARPRALICTPTWLSAVLIVLLVYLPVRLLGSSGPAAALTLGLLLGYQVYAVMHHALHHLRWRSPWWDARRQWHGQHHQAGAAPGRFGVTTGFWDHVFGTAQTPSRQGLPAHRRRGGEALQTQGRTVARQPPETAQRRHTAPALKPTERQR